MKNKTLISNIKFIFFIFLLNINALNAFLLPEEEIDQKNYVQVRIWNSFLKGGHNLGHAALAVYEDDKFIDSLYTSLFPASTSIDTALGSVHPSWHKLEDDTPTPDHIVNLYSLNRDKISKELATKQKEYSCDCLPNTHYTWTGDGADSPFVDAIDARNCASVVRDLLNTGGMRKFFQPNRPWTFPLAIFTPFEAVGGVGLGMACGSMGAVVGFLEGIVTWKNPFKSAVNDAKKASRIGSLILELKEQQLSSINYGHRYGENLIVTPSNVLRLAKDARELEKYKFQKTALWN